MRLSRSFKLALAVIATVSLVSLAAIGFERYRWLRTTTGQGLLHHLLGSPPELRDRLPADELILLVVAALGIALFVGPRMIRDYRAVSGPAEAEANLGPKGRDPFLWLAFALWLAACFFPAFRLGLMAPPREYLGIEGVIMPIVGVYESWGPFQNAGLLFFVVPFIFLFHAAVWVPIWLLFMAGPALLLARERFEPKQFRALHLGFAAGLVAYVAPPLLGFRPPFWEADLLPGAWIWASGSVASAVSTLRRSRANH